MVLTANTFAYDANDLIGTETATNNDAMTGFQQGLTAYNYNNLNQLLQTTSNPQPPAPSLFSYDASGNMTKAYTPEGYEFTAAYDAENRLKSIQYTDGASVVHKTEYIHGANGFVGIIKQYENGALIKETRLVRDGFLELQERDQNNNVTREYVWGLNLGGGIGGLLSLKQNGQNYHYLYDGKGNVNAVLDSAQQIVASYRYDTFGKLMVKSGTLDQPFQFSTKRYDPSTGLNNFGYRQYSASLGRWINRDPLGEDDEEDYDEEGIENVLENLYRFVGNDPINWVDPYGYARRGAIVGGVIGGLLGMELGSYLGGLSGLVCFESGPGVLVCIGVGGAIGSGVGLAGGVIVGAIIGSAVEDYILCNKWHPKPNRKKQGREPGEKKRQRPDWKPRNPPKEPPRHTPSRKN